MPSPDIVTVTVRLPSKLFQALEQLKRSSAEDEFSRARPPSRNTLICKAITEHVRAERRRVSR